MHTLLHLVPPALQQATANSHLRQRLLDTLGQVWVSLLWGHCSFLLVLVSTRVSLCPPLVCFPVLCKFWQLYGRVNGNLLQEGLCHAQVCCTQSPCPCNSPLLTRTSLGDTPCPRAKEKPQQDGRSWEITFRIKPHTRQRCSEGSNIPWVHQDPETPTETETELCLSVF